VFSEFRLAAKVVDLLLGTAGVLGDSRELVRYVRGYGSCAQVKLALRAGILRRGIVFCGGPRLACTPGFV
jgi:hypothetical protein